MGRIKEFITSKKPISHHIEEWNIFRILMDTKSEKSRDEKKHKGKKNIPHHLDEGDIFDKLLHK